MWCWPQRDMAVQRRGSISERMEEWKEEGMEAEVNPEGTLLLECLK